MNNQARPVPEDIDSEAYETVNYLYALINYLYALTTYSSI